MIRFVRGLCACILLVLPTLVQAAEPVWRGTLGTAAIAVELDPQSDTVFGRYFYTRHLSDITLEGQRSGTTLRVREPGEDDAKGPEWVLDTSTAGELRGEWVGVDGRRLPIRLSRFSAAKVNDRERLKLLRDDPYEYLRIAALRLEPGVAQTVGAYRLQWFEEPRTKVALFQVVSGYPEAERQRVNDRLRERQWQQISNAMECLGNPRAEEYDLTTTLRRIDATIISVSLSASYYCGGAHPDFGDAPLNIDPRTGSVLELEDVLWLGKGVPPRFEGATEKAFLEYRDNVLGPWLQVTMAKRYPNDVEPTEDYDCDYTDPQVWKFVSWYVRDDGLYLGPSFARAARNCEYPEWSVLPWQDIARHPGRVRIGPHARQSPIKPPSPKH
ncbi:hypothetical protein [Lysobacter tyrosinilyticus]